jgi:hypothetical protein
MAADLFSAVKKQFKLDEIESDNWVFKLFYRASFAICLAGSIMCVATTYIGTPIICDHRTEVIEEITILRTFNYSLTYITLVYTFYFNSSLK